MVLVRFLVNFLFINIYLYLYLFINIYIYIYLYIYIYIYIDFLIPGQLKNLRQSPRILMDAQDPDDIYIYISTFFWWSDSPKQAFVGLGVVLGVSWGDLGVVFGCLASKWREPTSIRMYMHFCTYLYMCILQYTHIYLHINTSRAHPRHDLTSPET